MAMDDWDHYLHVQTWRPNFKAEKEEINSLPWVRFPVLPGGYYYERWIKKAGSQIGRTIKVGLATLLALWGKFAHVCVEMDNSKPLMGGHKMRVITTGSNMRGCRMCAFFVAITAIAMHLALRSLRRRVAVKARLL